MDERRAYPTVPGHRGAEEGEEERGGARKPVILHIKRVVVDLFLLGSRLRGPGPPPPPGYLNRLTQPRGSEPPPPALPSFLCAPQTSCNVKQEGGGEVQGGV